MTLTAPILIGLHLQGGIYKQTHREIWIYIMDYIDIGQEERMKTNSRPPGVLIIEYFLLQHELTPGEIVLICSLYQSHTGLTSSCCLLRMCTRIVFVLISFNIKCPYSKNVPSFPIRTVLLD